MARVRANVTCFVDNGFREAGQEFDYDGPHNGCLEYLDGDDQEAEPERKRPGRKPKSESADDQQ